MDFSTINLAEYSARGADCHLEHPMTGELLYTEDGKPVSIRVLGQDSPEFRRAITRNSERNTNNKKATVENAEANAVELLTAMVVSWHGIEWDKKPLECTQDNVRMFLKAFPPIRSQLDAFIASRANFFTNGGKS